jgi:hypothetical protein
MTRGAPLPLRLTAKLRHTPPAGEVQVLYGLITSDVKDYVNLLIRIAHIICNDTLFPIRFVWNRQVIDFINSEGGQGKKTDKQEQETVLQPGIDIRVFAKHEPFYDFSYLVNLDICLFVDSNLQL